AERSPAMRVTKAQLEAQVQALRQALEEERAARVRLEASVGETLEQRAATSEILSLISRSPSDVAPVFESIVENAARLCDAAFSAVTRLEGGLLHLAAVNKMSPEEIAAYHKLFPRTPGRHFIMGRAFVEGRPVHVEDTEADPDYDPRTLSVLPHVRTY